MMIDSVVSQFERINIIEKATSQSQSTEPVLFRGEQKKFKRIRVPQNLPLYRTKNGRTTIAQNTLIRDKNLKDNAFTSGEEIPLIQNFQHGILLNLAKNNKGNIYKELGYVEQQRESLLMTFDGIIVNGNRRLAAMRDLYAIDPSRYSSFSHVDVVVLPQEATEKDIEVIETELQLTPDTKLDYGWVERRLKIRYQLNKIGFDRNEIKRIYRFKREDEMNAELQQLELAEEYLSTYLNEAYNYELVSDKEQLFSDLQKALPTNRPEEAEARRKIGFLIAKESRNLGDRAYSFKSLFGDNFAEVVSIFAEENNIPITGDIGTAAEEYDDLDDLESWFDDSTELVTEIEEHSNPYSHLIEAFDNSEDTNETAESLIAILESVKLQEKEEKLSRKGLQEAQNALRALSNIELDHCDTSTFDQLKGQLKAIIDTSNKLLNNLSERCE